MVFMYSFESSHHCFRLCRSTRTVCICLCGFVFVFVGLLTVNLYPCPKLLQRVIMSFSVIHYWACLSVILSHFSKLFCVLRYIQWSNISRLLNNLKICKKDSLNWGYFLWMYSYFTKIGFDCQENLRVVQMTKYSSIEFISQTNSFHLDAKVTSKNTNWTSKSNSKLIFNIYAYIYLNLYLWTIIKLDILYLCKGPSRTQSTN